MKGKAAFSVCGLLVGVVSEWKGGNENMNSKFMSVMR